MNELGNWISQGTQKPFYVRKEFDVKKEIVKAAAYVCGLGQFIFHLNGQKVADHELDPGWTNYDKKIQYVKFDITDLVHTGKNVLGAEVGNGWFIKEDEHYTFSFPAFMPPNPNPYKPFGNELVFAVKLILNYVDGTAETLFADETFKVKEHPVTMSNVYGSETYCAELNQKGWNRIDFDDSEWKNAVVVTEQDAPKGELIEQFQPAIKVICSYSAKYVHTVSGRDIYDLGQNVSGMLKLSYRGKKGEVIFNKNYGDSFIFIQRKS